MRLTRIIIATAGLAVSAGATAQSFNIDLNVGSGAGAGAPTSAFGGAAAQPGVWNSVTSASPLAVGLLDLNGNLSAATLSRASNGFFANKPHSLTSGDTERLLDDVQVAQGNETLTYTFNNLAAGTYLLYTYGGEVSYGAATRVTVTGSMGVDIQSVDGDNSNSLFPGRSFTIHGKTVAAGGSLTVVVSNSAFDADCYVAGFQLRKIDGVRARIYVDKNTPATAETGSSWGAAYRDPQQALQIASMAWGGNFDIWTANGIYTPTAGTTRTVSFVVPSGVIFRGGFAGSETSLAQRTNPRANPTYLSGGIGGASNTDNSFTVVDASNTSFSTLVEGFYITSGYGNQVGGNDGKGAGVKMVNGFANFRSCNIINNTASFAGAGVYASGGGPTFVDCIFYNNNNNGEGGAVHYANANSIFDLWNCTFLGNYSAGPGGGVELLNTSGRVVNCVFSGNTSSFPGGGLYASGASANALVINSTFANNGSSQYGGGMVCRNGGSLTLRNSIVFSNNDSFSATAEGRNVTIEGVGSGTTYSLQYSTIEGFSSLVGTACNGLAPQFVNAAGPDGVAGNFDDNLRLKSNSPMINAGSVGLLINDFFDVNGNGVTGEQLPIDLDGNPRRVVAAAVAPTGSGPAPYVDRGAYEYVPPCVGDTDRDGDVDFADLNNVLSGYGQSGFGLPGDVNGDNVVNFLDLNIVLSAYGTTC